MIRIATEQEMERWDELVAANPDGGNVLQGRAFAGTKAASGWKPLYLIDEHAGLEIAVLCLSRRLPRLGELWYAPKGPGVTDAAGLADFLESAKSLASERGVFMIKVEPDIVKSAESADSLQKLGLVKVRDLQFNYATINLDIRPDEDVLIESFRQKTRYNIRLAERKGVRVQAVEATEDNLQTMYQLMLEVGRRTGVFIRSYDYFKTFWQLHSQCGTGQLFFAKYEGKVLAGAFIGFLGKKGLYKDGGSTREHSNLQAPYLLQWEIIRWLKQHGVEEYDLHGVPAAHENDPAHPRYGLWLFKSGFSERVTEYVGTWDLPLDAKKYAAWIKYGERLAAGYTHRIKKELFY